MKAVPGVATAPSVQHGDMRITAYPIEFLESIIVVSVGECSKKNLQLKCE